MRYLGTIAAAAGAAEDNSSTAITFDLPTTACSLIIQPSATGLLVRASPKTGITANDYALGTQSLCIPWAGRSAGKLSIKNTSGGALSAKVYASDYPGMVFPLS